MSRVGINAAAILVFVISTTTNVASAATITSSPQVIQVTATVGSQVTAVVNQQGMIIAVFSNSNQKVDPVFVFNSVEGPIILASQQLRDQYDIIMKDKPLSYGYVYTQPKNPTLFWQALILKPAATIGL